MNKIPPHYDTVIISCHESFKKNCQTSALGWRMYKKAVIVDMILANISLVEILFKKTEFKFAEVEKIAIKEFMSIVNNGVIAIIQFTIGPSDVPDDITKDQALVLYEHHLKNAQECVKNETILLPDFSTNPLYREFIDVIFGNISELKIFIHNKDLKNQIFMLDKIINNAIFALMILKPN